MPDSCWHGSTQSDGGAMNESDARIDIPMDLPLEIGGLLAAYHKHTFTPRSVVASLLGRIEADREYCAVNT